jgi:hypothetical protein
VAPTKKIKDHVVEKKKKGIEDKENEVLYLGLRQCNNGELMVVRCATCGMIMKNNWQA